MDGLLQCLVFDQMQLSHSTWSALQFEPPLVSDSGLCSGKVCLVTVQCTARLYVRQPECSPGNLHPELLLETWCRPPASIRIGCNSIGIIQSPGVTWTQGSADLQQPEVWLYVPYM
jgi:hypothetical protein